MPTKNILAIDIGGTKIASGIVSFRKGGFDVSNYQKIKTPRNKKETIKKLLEITASYKNGGGFDGVGIATLGRVNRERGVVINAGNLKGWQNVNLKKIIGRTAKKEVRVDNDAKCFALAESEFGKSKKYKNAVYLAIGTGLGGAIKIDGKLYRGEKNIAGEFGHMVIVNGGEKCACGNRGCWQQYVSGKAIEKLYYKFYSKRKNARDIALDSERGSSKDKKIIKKTASYLAAGFINIANTINPEIIVVGGSVVKQKEILDFAVEEVKRKALIPARKTKIARSCLGEQAILIGAAILDAR